MDEDICRNRAHLERGSELVCAIGIEEGWVFVGEGIEADPIGVEEKTHAARARDPGLAGLGLGAPEGGRVCGDGSACGVGGAAQHLEDAAVLVGAKGTRQLAQGGQGRRPDAREDA